LGALAAPAAKDGRRLVPHEKGVGGASPVSGIQAAGHGRARKAGLPDVVAKADQGIELVLRERCFHDRLDARLEGGEIAGEDGVALGVRDGQPRHDLRRTCRRGVADTDRPHVDGIAISLEPSAFTLSEDLAAGWARLHGLLRS
jgi:hypothetical protein